MDTAARLLRLLVLVSSRGGWSADELADRLEVTTRTLRRDVTRLRSLGYPIESTTGPHGGYSLGAGGRLPPLLFDDDEAVAAVAGLRDVMRGSDPALAGAAMAALTKLGQVLPSAVRDRVATLTEVSVGLGRPASSDRSTPDVGVLMDVAVACRRKVQARFDYRAGDDTESRRHVEPHRLVAAGRRWYLVAFDLARDDWRTFRVDRIGRWVDTGVRAAEREAPDAAALVSEGIAVRVFDLQALVRIHGAPAAVARAVPPTVGVIQPGSPDDTSTLVRIGGDADWIARYLMGLEWPIDVIEPDEVRHEIVRLADELRRHHARPASDAPAGATAELTGRSPFGDGS